MHFSSSLILASLASLVMAQKVIDEFSFGHKQPLSPNAYSIPGWSILGEGHVPEVLSDRVVMTPPAGGNKRGALWSESRNSLSEWTADFEFRAGGQDRGGGNLQLWYVRDGPGKVSTGSLYSTRKFEGLAIVIDSVSGVQKIRAFLNDGNTDFKSHHTVESLAFGHCDYNYRNLGTPSKLQIKYGTNGLSVTVDGKQCFSTPKITLPTDYSWGMTAASADSPDSFEVYKFVISEAGSIGSMKNDFTGSQRQAINNLAGTGQGQGGQLASSAAQFEDVHSRIQALARSVEGLTVEIQATRQKQEEILKLLQSSNVQGAIDSKLNNMDRLVGEIHREVKSTDHKENYKQLSDQIQKTHEGITGHVPDLLRDYVRNHTPRIGFIAFSFMAFQSCCLGVLLFQKYRKSTMPKKYL